MAFLVKTGKMKPAGPYTPGTAVIQQMIQVQRAGKVVPQSTTEQLFRVVGGRVLVHRLVGTATVVLTATDPVLKVSSKQLDSSSVAVGTAVDVASTVSLASLEVGGSATVIGSGAALVKNNAGAGISTLGTTPWVAPQGEIYITTGASNTTGQMQWDIWYQPLDATAYVYAVNTATAAI